MPYYNPPGAVPYDSHGNIPANNFIPSERSQATAAGTTTLTVADAEIQIFTGSTTQTVVLPIVSTLPKTGFGFWIINDSSGALTVNSSGANLVATVPGHSRLWVFCTALTGTDAASWDVFIPVTGPASATDGHVATYSGATGKVLADGGAFPAAGASNIGYLNIPQNSQADDYTTVAADSGKHILETGASKTVTINKNATVPYALGTAISFIATDAGGCSIAIDTDTLIWAQDGSTGTRALAQYGIASAVKIAATTWIISGVGLS